MSDVTSESSRRRPNIVWVVCHDITAGLLGAYGNRLARTSTIDRLARDGIRFDNAFSVAPVCAPSRFALVTGLYPDSCGPAHHMRGIGHVPERFAPLPVLMREAGYWCTNNVFTDYNCDLDPDRIWDECSITAHWRGRPPGKPFFCVYNYLTTHESRLMRLGDGGDTDPMAVRVPPYLPDRPAIRRTLAANIDLVNQQDVGLAALLAQLDEDELAEQTIVVFIADHGGSAPRSKRFCYEEGLHIPLIVRVPDAFEHLRAGFAPGTPTAQVVSNVDLAPTTLALAGVAVPDYMHGAPFLGPDAQARTVAFSGRNRMDERYDMVRSARDGRFRYLRNYAPHRIYGLHNGYPWQLAGYRLWEQEHLAGTLDAVQERFWREKPAAELYDIEQDPFELHNLAGDPAHADRLAALSGALDEHLLAINDNGFVPEASAAEGYDASRAPGALPIAEVMALAARAIRRSADEAPGFLAALGSPNEIVRFWAAQGLLMAGVAAPRERLDAEPSAAVRCVLAEAIGRTGDTAVAVEALTQVLASERSPRVQLLAIESLTYLPPTAIAAARPAIEAAAGLGDEYLGEACRYLLLRIDGAYTPESNVWVAPDVRPDRPIGNPRL